MLFQSSLQGSNLKGNSWTAQRLTREVATPVCVDRPRAEDLIDAPLSRLARLWAQSSKPYSRKQQRRRCLAKPSTAQRSPASSAPRTVISGLLCSLQIMRFPGLCPGTRAQRTKAETRKKNTSALKTETLPLTSRNSPGA